MLPGSCTKAQLRIWEYIWRVTGTAFSMHPPEMDAFFHWMQWKKQIEKTGKLCDAVVAPRIFFSCPFSRSSKVKQRWHRWWYRFLHVHRTCMYRDRCVHMDSGVPRNIRQLCRIIKWFWLSNNVNVSNHTAATHLKLSRNGTIQFQMNAGPCRHNDRERVVAVGRVWLPTLRLVNIPFETFKSCMHPQQRLWRL